MLLLLVVLVISKRIALAQNPAGGILSGADHGSISELTGRAKEIYDSARAAREAGDLDRALGRFTVLRGMADKLGSGAANCYVLQEIADILRIQHRFDEALQTLKEALKACELRPDDRWPKALILDRIGFILSDQGYGVEARKSHDDALQLAQELKDQSLIAVSLNGIGMASFYLGDYDDAIQRFRDGIGLKDDKLDVNVKTALQINLANVYGLQGRYTDALQILDQADQQLRDEPPNDYLKGRILNNRSLIYFLQGTPSVADTLLQEALRIANRTHDQELTLLATNNLAVFRQMQGDVSEATREFAKLEQASADHGYLRLLAQVLSTAGTNYALLGRYALSQRCLQRADTLFEQLSDPVGRAGALNQLGALFVTRGRPDIASTYFDAALSALGPTSNSVLFLTVLNNLGEVNLEIARSQQRKGLVDDSNASIGKARDFLMHAKRIAETIHYPAGLANAIDNLASIYLMQNDPKAAIPLLRQAIELPIHNLHTEAVILNALATAYGMLREFRAAEEKLRAGIDKVHKLGARWDEVEMLTNLGALYEMWGKPDQAIDVYGQAMTATENARFLSGGEGFKAGLSEESGNLYEAAVDLLIRAGRPEDAFNVTERAHARALLDLMASPGGKPRAEAEAHLYEMRAAAMLEVQKLEQEVADEHTKAEQHVGIADLAPRLANAKQRLNDISQRLKNAMPDSSDLGINSQPFHLADIKASLSEDTTMLSYFVSRGKIYGFAIRHNAFQAFTVSMKTAEVNRRIKDMLSGDYDTTIDASKSLYKALVQPVQALSNSPVIVVIPHHALQYLPFPALMEGEKMLVDTHTVFSEPSASIFALLRKSPPEGGRCLLAVAEDFPLGEHPLANAEEEAKEAYKSLCGTSPDVIAHTKTALRAQASQFEVLHIAAHTEINTQDPLFSQILLGKDQWSDGTLELQEVSDLDLSKTSLVVLSACNGQWAPDSRGDEILTLSHAFLHAGVATVVASPGSVNDKAARAFMNLFYGFLGKHYSKADALRSAQIKVRQQYPLPSDWAAFVLTGDPGMLTSSNGTSGPVGMRILGIARGTQGPYLTVETGDGSCIRIRLTQETRIMRMDDHLGIGGPTPAADDLKLRGRLAVYATLDQDAVFYATEVDILANAATDAERPSACGTGLSAETQPAEKHQGSKTKTADLPQMFELDTKDPYTTDNEGGPITWSPTVRIPLNVGQDPVIARARKVTETFVKDLVNFICTQVTTRHESNDGTLWADSDEHPIKAQVTYRYPDKQQPWHEDYEQITIGDQPWKGEMMGLNGYTSTGEFGTLLKNLFSPGVGASFSFVKETRLNSREVLVYDYRVLAQHSDWQLTAGTYQVKPAYRGTVWIDKEKSWVWRIRHYADQELPADFPWRTTATDLLFDYTIVKNRGPFVIPHIASNTMCERDTTKCYWNQIAFTNYQRFVVQTTVGTKPTSSGTQVTPRAQAGFLLWSGSLDSLGLLTIEKNRVEKGKLSGRFPGTPITVTTDPQLTILDRPSKQNGWQRLIIKNGPKATHTIRIDWRSTHE